MTTPSPDFQGFEDAQIRLRAKFGRTVEFFAPMAESYPPGTKLDPERGRPYDPTIKPLSSGFSSAAVNCNVVDRPVVGRTLAAAREQSALGSMPDADKIAIVSVEDAPLASGATRARYLGEHFKVMDFRIDSLGPVERYLAFLQRR